MDESGPRAAFHATFDRYQPRAGAPDRAFQAVAESSNERVPGHRLATATAVALALLVIVTLLVGRGSFIERLAPVARVPAPARPLPAPASQPSPPAATAPSQPLAAAFDGRDVLVSRGQPGQPMLTTDGGVTWAVLRIPGDPALFDLQWIAGDTAAAATSLGLFQFELTTRTWSRLSSRNDLARLDFRSRTTGYAVTADGDVVETRDGGATFANRDVGLHPVSWIQWVSTTRAWAAGPDGVVATGDGGATWTRQLTVAASQAQVGFRDERSGFALFDGNGLAPAVYHTGDGGAHWTLEPAAPAGVHSQLVVTGAAQAELATTDVGTGATSVCGTADAGRTWDCRAAPYAGTPGTSALTVKGLTWTLVGSGLPVAVSQDGGDTWAIRRP